MLEIKTNREEEYSLVEANGAAGTTVDVTLGAQKSRPPRLLKYLLVLSVLIVSAVIGTALLIWRLNSPPNDFPTNSPLVIAPGTDVREITNRLQEAGVVKSRLLLYYSIIIFGDPTQIKASTYVFDQPLTTLIVAQKLAEGDFGNDLIRLTHIEGERASDLAERAAKVLPQFSEDDFISIAEPHEGELFPETYFLPASFTAEQLLQLLLETFQANISPLKTEIEASPLSQYEVLVLASIIEREANSAESMKLVSGVLQNRLAIGMPLQADASIEYILEKPLSELTPEDLKTDSPYNTYLHTDLPPTPIGNPGVTAIKAVLEPTLSPYLYYITDTDGVFHYAETYEEHLANVKKYLRQ